MRRPLAVAALALLAALAPLAASDFQPTASWGTLRYHPAFLETDRGIDPFVSTCRVTGHTPYTSANVDLIAGDGLVQLGQAAGCYTPQNEPSIAVDPNDPQHLVAGSNDYRLCCDRTGHNDGTGWAYLSRDGGRTWLDRLLPMLTVETAGQGFLAHTDSAGDPSVAITASGVVLYANIAFSRTDAHSAITLSRSTDGGLHWHNPRVIAHANDSAIFLDKEWVVAGPHHLVALTWTEFSGSGFATEAHIYAAISHDDGRSFGQPVDVIPGYPISQGSAPAFAPDGTLYVGYETADLTYGQDEIAYSIAHAPYSRFAVHELSPAWDGCYPTNTDGRGTLSGENFRVNSFPSLSIDPSSGTAAEVWTDNEAGCGQPLTDSQVKVVYVHGSHHSAAQTITNGADKTMPAAVLRDGVLTVGYYTTAYSTQKLGIDYAYVTSADGFVEHRLSDGTSDSSAQFKAAFWGDYSGAAEGSDGVVHFAFTDARGGDQNIFGAAVKP